MTTANDDPFAKALEADRAELNQRFKLCCAQGAPLDAAAFKNHLLARVKPIVLAVAERFPERARLATLELYCVSLELFRAGYWGSESRLPELNQLWDCVLPSLAHLIAREPERVSGSLSNALINLAKYPVRMHEWLERLQQLGVHCETVSQLLELGHVLSWQAGLTLLRQRSLETLSRWPRELACKALGLVEPVDDTVWKSMLEKLRTDRWYAPTDAQSGNDSTASYEAYRVGNYRAIGGAFSDLPRVSVDEGQLYVTDQSSFWRIEVDRFGCVLQPASAPPKAKLKKPRFPTVDVHGTIHWDDREQETEYLARPTSDAWDGQTLAVTLETSFHVYLFTPRMIVHARSTERTMAS